MTLSLRRGIPIQGYAFYITNIRQRGDVGGSAKKVGLRIKELERLYGITHGNNQNRTSQNVKSQEDLAKDMGMTVMTLNRYKPRQRHWQS